MLACRCGTVSRTLAPEGELFVTTLDGKTGRVYSWPSWKAVVKSLTAETVHRTAARDVLFLANHLGEDARVDSAGRLLLPKGVRNALGTSRQCIYLECEPGGSVSIYSQEQMDQRIAEARDAYVDLDDALSDI